MKNFQEMLDEKSSIAQGYIKKYLPNDSKGEHRQSELFKAMNYSVLAGGKRLRPVMLLESFRLCGGDEALVEDVVAPFMAAIEMIHTYSLVHDDLPAMDNDTLRRGKPTTHVAFGEAMAILAGDGLLNYAFETMCSVYQKISAEYAKAHSDIYCRLMHAAYLIAQGAGIYGMVGGQAIDIKNAQTMDAAQLKEMYSMKTSCLISSAMTAGAVLAGADYEKYSAIGEAGNLIGMAFQIQDDILDETSTPQVLGKPIHSDEKNNKLTYARLVGLENASRESMELSNRAIELLEEWGENSQFLSSLVKYLTRREK